jgi:3-deoxy-manno-octulosonate cytidylyltransferase (CMP-KDO synthetase)
MPHSTRPKVIGVIPSRYAAQRFPGKPLALIAGKPLVQWVYEASRAAQLVDEVIVATDDERILKVVESFGDKAMMTAANHPSGTDRVAEVAEKIPCDVVVNIQGDEPLIRPLMIDSLVKAMLDEPDVPMGTLARKIERPEELDNPNVVKVVSDLRQRALYFSRFAIPYVRDAETSGATHWAHVGIYAYRREALLRLVKLPVSELEQVEKLEQLRALQNGFAIKLVETTHETISVDTREDVARVEKILAANEHKSPRVKKRK